MIKVTQCKCNVDTVLADGTTQTELVTLKVLYMINDNKATVLLMYSEVEKVCVVLEKHELHILVTHLASNETV